MRVRRLSGKAGIQSSVALTVWLSMIVAARATLALTLQRFRLECSGAGINTMPKSAANIDQCQFGVSAP